MFCCPVSPRNDVSWVISAALKQNVVINPLKARLHPNNTQKVTPSYLTENVLLLHCKKDQSVHTFLDSNHHRSMK
jgi:hypothetical protein